MSVLGWKLTFMIKILVRAREYRSTTNFPKIPLCRPFIGLQSQKYFFALFLDREQQSKKYFLHYKPCPMTSLSSRKSWDILALSIEKIDFFIFSYFNLRVYTNGVISDQETVIFFEFSIVELTILRSHFFYLGLDYLKFKI